MDNNTRTVADAVRQTLLEMGRSSLAALKRVGFDGSDKQLLKLVERAVDDTDTVALVLPAEGVVEIIKSSLLQLVDDPRAGNRSVGSYRAAAPINYSARPSNGDDRAKRKLARGSSD
jgi:hypothetical protein